MLVPMVAFQSFESAVLLQQFAGREYVSLQVFEQFIVLLSLSTRVLIYHFELSPCTLTL